jgi:hypothetical protein
VELIRYCGGCGIEDVYIESKEVMLPVNHRPYALNPFYNSRWYPPPEEVRLGVHWIEKSSNRETLSEDGRLSIVVHKWKELPPPIQEDGTVIIDPEEEKKRHRKTDNWDSVPKLISEVAENPLRGKKVFIDVGPTVPVSDVLHAIHACRGCRGGYEILAPEIPCDEEK